MLLSPSLLRCNKKEEGDGNNVVVAFFATLQQKNETNDNLFSPSLLRCSNIKRRRQQ